MSERRARAIVRPLSQPVRQVPRLHFVYGWQLDDALRAKTCPSARPEGLAVLDDHDLGFFGHSPTWDGAEEAVVPCPGARVWGLLLTLSPTDADRLDQQLNVREDGSGTHFHLPVELHDARGRLLQALLYMRSRLDDPRPPSAEYRDRLAAAFAVHGLPPPYVARLRAIEAPPAAYPVPRRPRVIPLTAAGGCHCPL